jgi:glutathione S-transferase
VLVDGPDVVVGSLKILEHLCQRWPEPPLFPARVGHDAVVKAYDRIDTLFGPHIPRIARGTPEERVQALSAVRRSMGELDAEVPESGFLLGELSVADLALATVMAKLPTDWRPTQLGFEGLSRWERAVMQRPTVREQTGPKLAMAG